MLESHRRNHLTELCDGILPGGFDVGLRHTALEHLAAGLLGELFAGLLAPFSRFVERFCGGFVEKILIEQFHGWQNSRDGVARLPNPVLSSIGHIDAEPQRSLVDAHKFVVAENAFPHGVGDFLVADGEKFPLPDGFHLLNRRGREFHGGFVANRHVGISQQKICADNQRDDDAADDQRIHHRLRNGFEQLKQEVLNERIVVFLAFSGGFSFHFLWGVKCGA